ncbi:lysM domain receptor-like kinase 3-like [Hibiscus syriacus]|uniref:LysM domain receptor-like kinase 3-like n=1 Tax=Hibiscus syriacus TaxID=106335 RepID=A0A6A3CT62_HIBSY|nr:lysM domain receptor-like kinase 3-like [Hibiscus syriacus]
MKAIMRKRFVPTHYHRDLYHKLQNLKQGSKSVEDYFKEMEIAMIRANVDEDREATMARFLSGLNPDIANLVELQHYVEIEEMVHVTMKIERQLKRKSYTRSSPSSATKWKQEPITFRKPIPTKTKDHIEVSKEKQVGESSKGREKQTGTFERSRDIKCFKCFGKGHVASQCPNRNAMMVLDNGDIVSDSDEPIFDEEPETKQEEETEENADHGEMLVSKRCLQSQTSQEDIQRNNIFHTRCHVKDKLVGTRTRCFVTLFLCMLATSYLEDHGSNLDAFDAKRGTTRSVAYAKECTSMAQIKNPLKNEEKRNMTPNFFIEKHDGSRLENEGAPTKIGDGWNLKTQLFTKGFNRRKVSNPSFETSYLLTFQDQSRERSLPKGISLKEDHSQKVPVGKSYSKERPKGKSYEMIPNGRTQPFKGCFLLTRRRETMQGQNELDLRTNRPKEGGMMQARFHLQREYS